MKIKTFAHEGVDYAVLQDGKPVYVADDGKEIAFDAPGTVQTIGRLNGEAKGHRERAEAAEAKLKGFEGIDDPSAARKALETVQNLDSKRLIDAGEVEKVKAEVAKAYEAKLTEAEAAKSALEGELYGEKIGGAFARSKTIADKFAIPADLVQARFGGNFKLEGGKTVAYDANGNKLYSRTKPGEAADFEEALDMLVDAYPYKDQILKGKVGEGGGAHQPGGHGGPRTLSTAEFNKLTPAERAKAINSGEVKLTE